MGVVTVQARGPSIIGVVIAVTVPWMAFRLALRQDRARWLREQRLELYTDLLTEAYAELQYLEYELADPETRASLDGWWNDVRLPPLERARLGARGTVIGSREVNALFNRMQSLALRHTMSLRRDAGVQSVARVSVGALVDELQATVRKELGADDIRL